MANNQDHVWNILRDVLELLAGAGIPTPERGYILDGGWSLALSDLRRLVNDRNALRVQLKTAIAERDALRAELAAAKEERDRQYEYNAGAIAKFAALESERDQLAAHVERLEKALDPIARAYRVSMEPFAPGIDEADGAHHWMPHGWPSVADFKDANTALAATPAQSPETNSEQDFWARMQGPLVHCPNTASTSAGSSAAIELHAKQLREALETLNHAAKVAISSLYGSSFDEDTPLVIRLLDGTCDATDAVLAATPAQSLDAHDAWAVLEIGGEMDRNEVLERLLWMERWYESETNKGVHAPFATALRAAAELIRQGGWRPIAEVDAGEVIYAGKWNDRDEWQECWPIVADVAVSFGYTHHWPQMKKPEPPARKDSKAKNGEENDRQT